jgi:D-alanine-D-alanine ligase
VLSVLDPAKYEVTQIGITHDGLADRQGCPRKIREGKLDGLNIWSSLPIHRSETCCDPQKLTDIDVYFPVLHGTFGEDGTMQGLFELADVAYVGAGVVGSSVGMDKGVFKDVMVANNIPVVDTLVVLRPRSKGYGRGHQESGKAMGGIPLHQARQPGLIRRRDQVQQPLRPAGRPAGGRRL